MNASVPDLFHRWGPGAESGKRFARLVDLLLYQEARREKQPHFIFDDRAGDFHGLDSYRGGRHDPGGTIGYQYKFYASPFDSQHRGEIEASLLKAAAAASKLELRKWVLVSPQDLVSPATRKGGGDVEWFESLRAKHRLEIELEHIGHTKLQGLFQLPEAILLCLHYYPDLVPADLRPLQRTIEDTRQRHDRAFIGRHARITLVGFPALKDPLDGFPIEQIYVPLSVKPASGDQEVNPAHLLAPGARSVIVGDPGSGKTTLLKFLALAGIHQPVQAKYKVEPDQERLPVLVTLRRYVDELEKADRDIPLLDYIASNLRADLSLNSADTKFLERYLENRQAILLFDGLDELADRAYKEKVRDRIKALWQVYPGNTIAITSRLAGYDRPFRFDEADCQHFQVLPLNGERIAQFVAGWYALRYPQDPVQQREGTDSLLEILRDPERGPIRDLAENPLLLTLIALVHRSEAMLPDKRVVLYEKCVELLLHTWHAWQIQGRDAQDPSNTDSRNRRWLEEIANWMQESGTAGKRELAVKPYEDLLAFLAGVVSKDQRVDHAAAWAEAREFLKFVRERAGLLVESGDRQYSFVHLTFQEYLTASHRITLIQETGLPAQQEALLAWSAEPRWHEVIRLWVASLKLPTRQEEAIQAVLSKPGAQPALLAGGVLLDSVEGARWCAGDIVRRLLSECCQEAGEHVPALLGLLRRWLAKDTGHAGLLWNSLPGHIDPVALGLCLSCLDSLDPKETGRWVKRSVAPEAQLPFVLLLPDLAAPADAAGERQRLAGRFRAMQSYLLIYGSGGLPAYALPVELLLLDRPGTRLFEVGLQSALTASSVDHLLFGAALDRDRAVVRALAPARANTAVLRKDSCPL